MELDKQEQGWETQKAQHNPWGPEFIIQEARGDVRENETGQQEETEDLENSIYPCEEKKSALGREHPGSGWTAIC